MQAKIEDKIPSIFSSSPTCGPTDSTRSKVKSLLNISLILLFSQIIKFFKYQLEKDLDIIINSLVFPLVPMVHQMKNLISITHTTKTAITIIHAGRLAINVLIKVMKQRITVNLVVLELILLKI